MLLHSYRYHEVFEQVLILSVKDSTNVIIVLMCNKDVLDHKTLITLGDAMTKQHNLHWSMGDYLRYGLSIDKSVEGTLDEQLADLRGY